VEGLGWVAGVEGLGAYRWIDSSDTTSNSQHATAAVPPYHSNQSHTPNETQRAYYAPESEEDVAAIVADCHKKGRKLRVVGSALSPNGASFSGERRVGWAARCAGCALFAVRCACALLCAVCCVLCAVCCVLCAVCCVPCAVCRVLCVLLPVLSEPTLYKQSHSHPNRNPNPNPNPQQRTV